MLFATVAWGQERPKYVEGEIIVGLEGSGRTALATVRDILPGEVKRESLMRSVRPPSDKKEYVIVQLPAGVSVEEGIERLKAKNSPHVRYVEPNYLIPRLQSFSEPDDTHWDHQWTLHNEGQDFWPLSSPSWGGTVDKDLDWLQVVQDYIDDDTDFDETVVVAVIDSGVMYSHEDLTNMMWVNSGETWMNWTDDDSNGYVDDYYGMDFSNSGTCSLRQEDGDPSDGNGHGTHVAGIIAAEGDNAKGITGIGGVGETSTGSPPIKIMACKVYDNDGENAATSMMADCMDYVADMYDDGVNVLVTNHSYGGFVGPYGTTYEDALDRLESRGILFVAAAGNDGLITTYGSGFYPVNYTDSNVVGVGAGAATGGKWASSNYSATHVDLAAPGHRVLGPWPEHSNFVLEDFEDCDDGELPTGWTQDGDETWGCKDTGSDVILRANYAGSYPYAANKTSTLYSPVWDTRNLPNLELIIDSLWETDEDGTAGDGADCRIWLVNPCVVQNPGSWAYMIQIWSKYWENYPYWYKRKKDVERGAHQYWQFKCTWFTDDDDNNYYGVSIDDFQLKYVSGDGDYYTFATGTSMATPHVAGAAALHYAMDDSLSMSDVKDLLYGSGATDPESDWVGKSVSEGNLNLWQTDVDSDGDLDRNDNCIDDANSGQEDEDSNGFGNVCDSDCSNSDDYVDTNDYIQMMSEWGSDGDCDLNGDDTVDTTDYIQQQADWHTYDGPAGDECAGEDPPTYCP
jgi:subtilisin family serine protease